MKSMQVVLSFLSALSLSQISSAQPAAVSEVKVGSGAVQTLIPSSFAVRLSAANDIADGCALLEQGVRLFNRPGSEGRLRDYIEENRVYSVIEGMEIKKEIRFEAPAQVTFDLLTAETRKVLAASLETGRRQAKNPELLVDAQQIRLWPQSLEVGEKQLVIKSGLSIVGLARKLGLKSSAIRVELAFGGLVFATEGLDVACDVLAGRVEVQPKAVLAVALEEKAVERLKIAASELRDLADGRFSQVGSVNSKVAKLGFELGREWMHIARDLPRAADDADQSIGLMVKVADLEKGTVLRKEQLDAQFPDVIEVTNAQIRFEVAR